MNIKMYKNKVDNTFTFKVYRAKKPILLGKTFPSKEACLTGIEQSLAALRSNNMINIRSKEGGGGFLFSTGNVESCLFKSLDQASDGLAFLKETIGRQENLTVSFDTQKEQVISKKKIGRSSEGYDFKQVSKSKKPGFELLDKDSANFYFHFNDKNGNPILFSRSYDGKTIRTKAAKKLIAGIKDKSLQTEILTAGSSSVFLLKTPEQEEIARSKRFKNNAIALEALKDFKKDAVGKAKALKLTKKKKKKEKKNLPKKKYSLTEVAPIGNIGFEAFRSKKNKFHYFQFFDKKGSPLLSSKAFEGRSKRDDAITEAIELSQDKRLYAISEKEGNYHFILQNAKGKGLAKSRIFSTKAELIEGMRYFHSNAKSYSNLNNVIRVSSSEKIPININRKKDKSASPASKRAASKNTSIDPNNKVIDTTPAASKELPLKKEVNPKNRKETPRKTPPKQQQDKPTNKGKNTPPNPSQSAPKTDAKQVAKKSGNNQPNNRKQSSNQQSNSKQSGNQQSNSKQSNNQQSNSKQSNSRQSNNQQSNSKQPPAKDKPSRSNQSNRNTNKRNRNHPPLKEGESSRQASTRTNYASPATSKSSIKKDAPPRILPKGETEIPRLGFWKWLIPLILAVLIGLWLIRSCGGGIIAKEAVGAKPIIEKAVEPVVEKLPTLLGVTSEDLGFKKEMVAAKIADFLSLPGSVFPATFILDKVHFPSNQDQLDQEAYAQLDRMILILKSYPKAVVQIKGHTDSEGVADRNLQLSEERASIVSNYLIGKGLQANRISAKGFGEAEPIETNDTTTGRAANRRSEIVLIKR